MNRKTEITFQTRRVLVIRRLRKRERVWCDRCGRKVEMCAVEEASSMSGLSERAIFRLAEAGLLHATEMPDGRLFVCLGSEGEVNA